jgi:opacity protein-like surface antigen
VNTNLSNITSRLTNIFGVLGRIQAWNGNFGIVTDGVYVNSGFRSNTNGRTFTLRDRFDINIPGFQVDTKNTLASFSLAASYRVVTVPFRTITDPANPSQYYPAISFEVLAGFRYLSLFQSVDFENGPNFEFSGSEFNPMLGGTVKLMLSNNFSLFFRGDTSNLGGGALKQYYNLYGGLDWKFSGSFALRLSYRFNEIEFVKQGRFGGDNGLNLRTQGVQLGLSWQF